MGFILSQPNFRQDLIGSGREFALRKSSKAGSVLPPRGGRGGGGAPCDPPAIMRCVGNTKCGVEHITQHRADWASIRAKHHNPLFSCSLLQNGQLNSTMGDTVKSAKTLVLSVCALIIRSRRGARPAVICRNFMSPPFIIEHEKRNSKC